MTEPTVEKQKNHPIIRGYTREGQKPAELTLWVNMPEDGKELGEKAPDFRGVVLAGKEKVYVSVWAYAGGVSEKEGKEGKAYPPYMTATASIKQADGTFKNETLDGVLNGMFRTTVNNEKIDVDGSRGLKVIGQLKGKTVLTEGITITGNLNGRHPDKDLVYGLAEQLGFKPEVVNTFKSFVEKDAENKKAARPS